MKRSISIALAVILAFACVSALGGCGGKAAESKDAFIASRGYYSELIDTLAAPVADIDAAAIADTQAEGMTGSITFSLEGLEWLSDAMGKSFPDAVPMLADFAAELDFVSDGAASSGDIALTMLGETLKAAFSSDGSDVVLSIPDLLSRVVLFNSNSLSAYGPEFAIDDDALSDEDLFEDGDEDTDDDIYEDDHGLIEVDDAAYDAEYDFDENGKYVSEDGDLYVDTDGDGKLDLVFGPGYDEDFVDNVIRNTREFYEDGGSSFGFSPLDPELFNTSHLTLMRRFFDLFLEKLPESCYSSGRERFRTAEGKKELDCLTLSANGSELAAAYKKSLEELADVAIVDETYGDDAETVREMIREAAAECDEPEFTAESSKCALSWTRFTKDGTVMGDRIYIAAPDAEYTLEAGLDDGAEKTFAFLKLTDEKQGVDLLDAESTIGGNKGELELSFVVDGNEYSFKISGKTTENNGVKTTEANIKVGFGALSFDIFDLKTTVRAFDENAVDFDFELSSDITSLLFGEGKSFCVKLTVEAHRDATAAPEAIDTSDAYTADDTYSEAFKEELDKNLQEKYPNTYEFIKNYNAFADEVTIED